MREQMEGIAIAIAPMTIGKKRDKKMIVGKPAKTSYTYSEGGRATYAEGGMTQIQKLKTAADVATFSYLSCYSCRNKQLVVVLSCRFHPLFIVLFV